MLKKEFEKMVELLPTLTNLIKPEEISEVQKIHLFWAWDRSLPHGNEVVHWSIDDFSNLEYSMGKIAGCGLQQFRLMFIFDNAKTKAQNYHIPKQLFKNKPDSFLEGLRVRAEKRCREEGKPPRS